MVQTTAIKCNSQVIGCSMPVTQALNLRASVTEGHFTSSDCLRWLKAVPLASQTDSTFSRVQTNATISFGCPCLSQVVRSPSRAREDSARTGAVSTTDPGTGLGQSTPLTIANAGLEHFETQPSNS